MNPVCAQCLAVIFPEEGGYTNNPADPGNWTGGRQGMGSCNGTNFGISAKAYPAVDIRSLTREGANAIYERDYFLKFNCDKLPAPLALLVMDCAVNGGHPIEWLQQAVGTTADGVFGPHTLSAIEAHRGQGASVCARFMQLRWLYLTELSTWPTFKGGWSARLSALPFSAMTMKEA